MSSHIIKLLPFLSSLHLQSFPAWETENKIYCKQTLVDGDGPKTFWSRELLDDELTLVRSQLIISLKSSSEIIIVCFGLLLEL